MKNDRLPIRISSDLKSEFRQKCEKNGTDMSKKVNELIRNWLKSEMEKL